MESPSINFLQSFSLNEYMLSQPILWITASEKLLQVSVQKPFQTDTVVTKRELCTKDGYLGDRTKKAAFYAKKGR